MELGSNKLQRQDAFRTNAEYERDPGVTVRKKAILRPQLQRQDAVDCMTDYEKCSIENLSAKIEIQTHYIDIVRNLCPEEIIDFLYQLRIINEDYCNAIRKEVLRSDKCRELMQILVLSQHPTACLSFKEALKSTHAFLIDILEQPRSPVERLSDTMNMFNEKSKIALSQHLNKILTSVHPDSVMDALVSRSIITCVDRQRLMSSGRGSTHDQLLALWNHLNKVNTPYCFAALKTILCEENYDWIFSSSISSIN